MRPRGKGKQVPSLSGQSQPSRQQGDEDNLAPAKPLKRLASLYDTVAGRVGLNGFLSEDQMRSSNINPLAPEEALFRRLSAPTAAPYDFYRADERLPPGGNLPDSDLLKALHSYVSDFYYSATEDRGRYDSRSLNETALLAMGILLEEVAREALGDTGDMVLVEPAGLDQGLPESKMVEHQVRGIVKAPTTPEYHSDGGEDATVEEARPRKRKYRRSGDIQG